MVTSVHLSVAGYTKRLQEVKHIYEHKALTESPGIHKDRRKFLRMALKEVLCYEFLSPNECGGRPSWILRGGQ